MTQVPSWTTPDGIVDQLRRRWDRGEMLAARVSGESLFPLELRLSRPKPRDIADRFGEVIDWARALQAGSRETLGYGYELQYERVRNRVHGENAIPCAAVIPSERDALRLLRQNAAIERFQSCADATLARFPELRAWLQRRPLTALQHAEDWDRVLAVLTWFRAHPRPGVYLRQLEIPHVDTKFIEARRGLLIELLDQVLPADAIDASATGVRGFGLRYGLAIEPPLVRFRILDPDLRIQGLTDLSVPPNEFAELDLPAERIFVTENRINGLAFPECPRSIVIFGLGYGIERLAEAPWLHRAALHYWGDIDTHGFGILNRLRAGFPEARSLLMDRQTLEAHRDLWGQEPADKRYTGNPTRLNADEWKLLEDLREDRLGERVRLEQERVVFSAVRDALSRLHKADP